MSSSPDKNEQRRNPLLHTCTITVTLTIKNPVGNFKMGHNLCRLKTRLYQQTRLNASLPISPISCWTVFRTVWLLFAILFPSTWMIQYAEPLAANNSLVLIHSVSSCVKTKHLLLAAVSSVEFCLRRSSPLTDADRLGDI